MADAAGPARRLLYYGNPRLRLPTEPADPGAADLDGLVREMTRWMRRRDGVGLAAPQVGDPRRLVLVDPEFGGGDPLVLLNPVLEETFGAPEPFEEGCLSFPGVFRTVRRPRGARVSYTDRGGEQRELRDDGLLARVLQHELDHLDGILFVDHLGGWQRFRVALDLRLRGLYGGGGDG